MFETGSQGGWTPDPLKHFRALEDSRIFWKRCPLEQWKILEDSGNVARRFQKLYWSPCLLYFLVCILGGQRYRILKGRASGYLEGHSVQVEVRRAALKGLSTSPPGPDGAFLESKPGVPPP